MVDPRRSCSRICTISVLGRDNLLLPSPLSTGARLRFWRSRWFGPLGTPGRLPTLSEETQKLLPNAIRLPRHLLRFSYSDEPTAYKPARSHNLLLRTN